jgi:membrane protein
VSARHSDRSGAAAATDELPGGQAQGPTEIPPRGWWQVLRRAYAESQADNVSILAGGVAFFAFLAVFPTLIAALTLYGLVADPAQITQQVDSLAGALPPDTRQLIDQQLTALTSSSGGALTFGLVISLAAALWSASSGTSGLMTAITLAYDQRETRGLVKLRATALGLTLGAIVFFLVAVTLIAVVPTIMDYVHLGTLGRLVAQILRWALLIVVFLFGLAVVYRVAPNRADPQSRWVTPGALVATVLWLIGSAAFSLYVTYFGNYGKTYGALTGVIVLMLWLYLTSYIVLLGAEINAEAERQTTHDTTVGEPAPMGRRGAVAADTQAAPDS